MTTATFVRRTALFRFGEHERGVVVRVKGDNRIKALALLALEAFQDFRLSDRKSTRLNSSHSH